MNNKILREYKGKGELLLGNNFYKGDFYLFQLISGDINLEITLDSYSNCFLELYDRLTELKFNGKTEEGYLIHSDNVSSISNYPDSHFNIFKEKHLLTLDRFEVKFCDDLTYINTVEYFVTNLIIKKQPLLFNIQDNIKKEVKVIKLGFYENKVNSLKYFKGINVTCKMIVKVNSAEEIELIKNMINSLCYLLSTAKGTKINYISYRLKFNNKIVLSNHENRITKNYYPYPVILGDFELIGFIETVFPQYCKLIKETRFNNLIDAFIDAKSEHDFLELRCLKLVIIMEMFVNVFSDKYKSSINLIIIDKKDFNELKNILKNTINKFFEQKQVSCGFEAIFEKLPELNRLSFRDSLKILFKRFDILNDFDDHDIDLFIKIRNSFVHRVNFLYSSQPDEAKKYDICSTNDEWGFLLNFLDKVFLLILGYAGKYLNYTNFPPEIDELKIN